MRSDETVHDSQKIIEIFKSAHSEFDKQEIDEKCIIRLGRRKPDSDKKPRPVKITFKDPETKMQILRNAHLLKEKPQFRYIGMAPDKTLLERRQDKEKRDDFKKRKETGEDVVWFRGNVILKSERDRLTSHDRGSGTRAEGDKLVGEKNTAGDQGSSKTTPDSH